MIGKLVKRLAVLLGALITISIVLAVVGAVLLPKDKVKGELAKSLAESTGAEVVLGEASVKWWPKLAVKLEGGSISGTGTGLSAATGSANNLGDFRVDLKEISIDVGLKALLKKQIEVGSVRVAGPLLRVAWDKGELLAEQFAFEILDLQMPLNSAQAASGGKSAPGESIPRDLALAFTGEVGRLSVQRVAYDEVVFGGDLDARVLTLGSFLAKRATGTITGSGEIDYERDPWGVADFQAEAQTVPAGSLLEPWAPELAKRMTGDLTAQVAGTCRLRDADQVRSTLSLNGDISCGEGVLAAGDWLGDIAPYLGNRQDLTNIRFHSLAHSFRVDEGKYLLENLAIDGNDTDWEGTGWVGLDGTIDANLQVKLPPGFTPDLGQWSFLAGTLRDESGRVNLDLHLTGMAATPNVGLNLGSLKNGATSTTTETLKKGLGGLLDKLKTR